MPIFRCPSSSMSLPIDARDDRVVDGDEAQMEEETNCTQVTAEDEDESVGDANAMPTTPSWGVLNGKDLPPFHLYADKAQYTIGRSSRSDVVIPQKHPLANHVSTCHVTIRWNGWGVPGYGHQVGQPDQLSQHTAESRMAFTIEDHSRNGVQVGGRTIKGQRVPLDYGNYINFLSKTQIQRQNLDPDALRYCFMKPEFSHVEAPPVEGFFAAYSLGKKIAAGNYGEVYVAHPHTGPVHEVAAKIMLNPLSRMSDAELLTIERECDVMMKIGDHPNVIRIHETFRERDRFYIVMDLVGKGELFSQINKSGTGIKEDRARRYLRDICEGMAFVHSKGIVHRDLKPENILVTDENRLKIGDFGLAKVAHSKTNLKTTCGTLTYAAPEVVRATYRAPYNDRVDSWSVGIIMFVMVTCQYPWDDPPAGQPPQVPDSRRVKWHLLKKKLGNLGEDFIRRLLVNDPRDRMSLTAALEHPWLRSGRVEEVDRHPLLASNVAEAPERARSGWSDDSDGDEGALPNFERQIAGSGTLEDPQIVHPEEWVQDSQEGYAYGSFGEDGASQESVDVDMEDNDPETPTGARSFVTDGRTDSSSFSAPTDQTFTSNSNPNASFHTANSGAPSDYSVVDHSSSFSATSGSFVHASPHTVHSLRMPGAFNTSFSSSGSFVTTREGELTPTQSHKRTAEMSFGPSSPPPSPRLDVQMLSPAQETPSSRRKGKQPAIATRTSARVSGRSKPAAAVPVPDEAGPSTSRSARARKSARR